MKMIEKVARAIAKNRMGDPDLEVCLGQPQLWEKGFIPSAMYPAWTCYVGLARYAIEAMREPSDKMLVEMESKAPQLQGCFNTKETSPSYLSWKAAIDAALNE